MFPGETLGSRSAWTDGKKRHGDGRDLDEEGWSVLRGAEKLLETRLLDWGQPEMMAWTRRKMSAVRAGGGGEVGGGKDRDERRGDDGGGEGGT